MVFGSHASNLIDDDGNGFFTDIFVRDLVAGVTVLASVDADGADANDSSYWDGISADGRFVAFQSWADDLVEGDNNNLMDMFVRDLAAGTTVRASVDTEGGDANGTSSDPSISADGRYVVFHSYASDLVEGDGNGENDVFVRDVLAGTTVRASVDPEAGEVRAQSLYPQISANGRYVAFESWASNLVPGDEGTARDVFVRDLAAGITTRVSVDVQGNDANANSCCAAISADGRNVAFTSSAGDLIPGSQERLGPDVFVTRWV